MKIITNTGGGTRWNISNIEYNWSYEHDHEFYPDVYDAIADINSLLKLIKQLVSDGGYLEEGEPK